MKFSTQTLCKMYGSYWSSSYRDNQKVWTDSNINYSFERYSPILKSVTKCIGSREKSQVGATYNTLDEAVESIKSFFGHECDRRLDYIKSTRSKFPLSFYNWVYNRTGVHLSNQLIVLLGRQAQLEYAQDNFNVNVFDLPDEIVIRSQPVPVGSYFYRADTSVLTFGLHKYRVVSATILIWKDDTATIKYHCENELEESCTVFSDLNTTHPYSIGPNMPVYSDPTIPRQELKEAGLSHVDRIRSVVETNYDESSNREDFLTLFTKYMKHKIKSI